MVIISTDIVVRTGVALVAVSSAYTLLLLVLAVAVHHRIPLATRGVLPFNNSKHREPTVRRNIICSLNECAVYYSSLASAVLLLCAFGLSRYAVLISTITGIRRAASKRQPAAAKPPLYAVSCLRCRSHPPTYQPPYPPIPAAVVLSTPWLPSPITCLLVSPT